jgi:alpha/beta superfamily hydrolase
MPAPQEHSQFIRATSGQLELRYSPSTAPNQETPVVVISHPHPLGGGSLNNKVVYIMHKAFSQMGCHTVRHNFRGVGKSEGSFDNGQGESDDLQQICHWAQQQHPQSPLWLAGFSFGAYVSLRALKHLPVQRLLMIAPPISLYAQQFQQLDISVPSLIIQGSDDEIIEANATRDWAFKQPLSPDFYWLSGASHFFHGRLNQLRQLIQSGWHIAI